MSRPAWIVALALLAGPAAAQVDGSVVPEQRPGDLADDAGEVADRPSEDDAVPPADPADIADSVAEGEDAVVVPQGDGQRDLLALPEADYAACLAALDALGVEWAEVDPILPEGDRDCGIVLPIEVSSLGQGVALSPAAVLRCPTARALAGWTQDFVMPAAERLDRGALTEIRGGTGYTCRRRNNQPTGKLSEHAFGNAFDLTSFVFADGAPIPIMPRARDGTIEESFQDATRAAACMEFTTVIGPGSDPYHDDHLHFDVAARGSGFRLCEQGAAED
jgi:hypothetical protein